MPVKFNLEELPVRHRKKKIHLCGIVMMIALVTCIISIIPILIIILSDTMMMNNNNNNTIIIINDDDETNTTQLEDINTITITTTLMNEKYLTTTTTIEKEEENKNEGGGQNITTTTVATPKENSHDNNTIEANVTICLYDKETYSNDEYIQLLQNTKSFPFLEFCSAPELGCHRNINLTWPDNCKTQTKKFTYNNDNYCLLLFYLYRSLTDQEKNFLVCNVDIIKEIKKNFIIIYGTFPQINNDLPLIIGIRINEKYKFQPKTNLDVSCTVDLNAIVKNSHNIITSLSFDFNKSICLK